MLLLKDATPKHYLVSESSFIIVTLDGAYHVESIRKYNTNTQLETGLAAVIAAPVAFATDAAKYACIQGIHGLISTRHGLYGQISNTDFLLFKHDFDALLIICAINAAIAAEI